jgi:hypothetical protein
MPNSNRSSAQFLLGMAVWLVLACMAGASGRVAALTPPQPQIVIAVLSVALFLWGWLHPGLRAWLGEVNLRGFVAFHITRFVGVLFLLMSASGELGSEWAIAGWGFAVATRPRHRAASEPRDAAEPAPLELIGLITSSRGRDCGSRWVARPRVDRAAVSLSDERGTHVHRADRVRDPLLDGAAAAAAITPRGEPHRSLKDSPLLRALLLRRHHARLGHLRQDDPFGLVLDERHAERLGRV